MMLRNCALLLLLMLYIGSNRSLEASIDRSLICYDHQSAPVRFAVAEMGRALQSKSSGWAECDLNAQQAQTAQASYLIAFGSPMIQRIVDQIGVNPPERLSPQTYAIRVVKTRTAPVYVVFGADAVGAMYGGLDLAEAIRLGTLPELVDSHHSPYIERRGIKFNIPLDARTPSYSDNSDAAQQNIPEMWSFDFWREFLDEMARHRFNVLTLWSLHPFPSLVRVPEFPDVALDDVKRTRVRLDDSFSHTGSDMVRPELLENLETIKNISIDEKIQFWRDVMQYAADRGIEVYVFTWNIFTFGAEGKYGITPAQDNDQTIAYFRASIREMILTYPLLAGFGITAGEQMEDRDDGYSKEKWLWKTYGLGILDAKKIQPDRHIRLIHRYHQTAQSEILTEWESYPDTFDLSFKYAIAHMYSTPAPPFLKTALPHIPEGRRTWLTVRNDDIYSFRWGDPAFARAFIRNIPGREKIAGFYMGPDGYNWGREFLSTELNQPRELVMKKQWLSFMLWGRLSYEPDLPDELFLQTLSQRFPEVPSQKLLTAWSAASRIFPQITRFFWGDIDLKWYPEASLSHPRHKGFYTVRHFIEGETMPESGILDILTYRYRLLNNIPMEGITPLEVAQNLKSFADTALTIISELRALQSTNKELRLTLGDIEAMSHLGNYYAEKIAGSTDLAIFDQTADFELQRSSIRHLEAALGHWERYASIYSSQYLPQLLNRVGFIDMKALTSKVARDVELARTWQPGTIPYDEASRTGKDVPFRN